MFRFQIYSIEDFIKFVNFIKSEDSGNPDAINKMIDSLNASSADLSKSVAANQPNVKGK